MLSLSNHSLRQSLLQKPQHALFFGRYFTFYHLSFQIFLHDLLSLFHHLAPVRSLFIHLCQLCEGRWNINVLRTGMRTLPASDAGGRTLLVFKCVDPHGRRQRLRILEIIVAVIVTICFVVLGNSITFFNVYV